MINQYEILYAYSIQTKKRTEFIDKINFYRKNIKDEKELKTDNLI
jgi:hypothetical protein